MDSSTFFETLRALCADHHPSTHPSKTLCKVVHFWRRYAHSFPYTTRVVARTYLEEHLGGDLTLWSMIARGQLPLAKALAYVLQNPHHAPFLLQRIHIDPLQVSVYSFPPREAFHHVPSKEDIAYLPIPENVFVPWVLFYVRMHLDVSGFYHTRWRTRTTRLEHAIKRTETLTEHHWEDLRRCFEEPHGICYDPSDMTYNLQYTQVRERLLHEAFYYFIHALSSLLYTTPIPRENTWERVGPDPSAFRANAFDCVVQIALSLEIQYSPDGLPREIPDPIFSTYCDTIHYRLSVELATEVLRSLQTRSDT